MHLGTVAHEAKTEHEDSEDGSSSRVGDEPPKTEDRQQNEKRSDGGMDLPEPRGDHQVALGDGTEEANNATIAPAIEVENGGVNISRASPIEHEVADYGLVGSNDESDGESSSHGDGDAVAPPSEAVAGDDSIAEEEEVADEPNSDPIFTPPNDLTAGDDSATTAENDLLRIDVLANGISWNGINDLHIDSVSLTSGEGSVRIEGGTVIYDPGAAYDHLSDGEQAVVTLSYQVSNDGGLSDRGSVTITVVGANDGPVDLTFVDSEFNEYAASGTVVATLSTVDADAGDSFNYAITSNPSGFFEVVGNEIRVAAGADIDFEVAASHDVTISVTDSGVATYDEVVTLNVDDANDAPVDLVFAGASQDFIENGSFEAATGNGATSTLPGWSFTSGTHVDTWHASSVTSWLGGADSIDGNYHLDLDAGGSNAQIAQDVDNLIDGQTYELTFDYSDYTTA